MKMVSSCSALSSGRVFDDNDDGDAYSLRQQSSLGS